MGRHIVTVARQFGCGGGEIAKKLAEQLSVEYFDKELLEKAAEASGISRDAFARADERAASSFLYSLAMSSYNGHISPVSYTHLPKGPTKIMSKTTLIMVAIPTK